MLNLCGEMQGQKIVCTCKTFWHSEKHKLLTVEYVFLWIENKYKGGSPYIIYNSSKIVNTP